ncbi:MAG: ribbon-helix-helix domain-containing protein [Gammaproteobacteria bacterium]|nr:ribbon-helix-helix domain-containing protein [Gammaproteobacteria bacterium]
MRLTISMDDRLADEVRRAAMARGLSVSAFIARILDDALKRPEPTQAKPFRLITVGGEGPRPGVDLDRPRELESRDDEARYG